MAPLLLVRGGGAGVVGVCSGGVLLFRSLVGAVPLALGGLASGFGMGPGVSPPAVAAGTVVGCGARPLVAGPPLGGVGWVGSGLRSGRGWSGSPPAPARSGAGAGVRGCVWVCGSCRPISTGRLSPLPGLHLRPIDPVVHWGPSTTPPGGVVRGPGLGGGFPLRCLQRLPFPDVANQRCPWRDNWRTRGPSVPVLSYWGRVSSSLLRAQRIGTELSHDVLNPARVPL